MRTRHVTDGGLETELIFLRGLDLPEFAAFPAAGASRATALTLPEAVAAVDDAELDESTTLDAGDPERLAADQQPLLDAF